MADAPNDPCCPHCEEQYRELLERRERRIEEVEAHNRQLLLVIEDNRRNLAELEAERLVMESRYRFRTFMFEHAENMFNETLDKLRVAEARLYTLQRAVEGRGA